MKPARFLVAVSAALLPAAAMAAGSSTGVEAGFSGITLAHNLQSPEAVDAAMALAIAAGGRGHGKGDQFAGLGVQRLIMRGGRAQPARVRQGDRAVDCPRVGDVERVIFDADSNRITGIVIRRGWLLKHEVVLDASYIVEVVGEIELFARALARLVGRAGGRARSTSTFSPMTTSFSTRRTSPCRIRAWRTAPSCWCRWPRSRLSASRPGNCRPWRGRASAWRTSLAGISDKPESRSGLNEKAAAP